MILEIKNRTKVAKEIIFKCDHCSSIFSKPYKEIYIIKLYHLCSIYCVNQEKKNNGFINNKYKNTCLNKYGVINVFQNNIIKKDIKNTIISKYNVENISKLDSIKQKKKITCKKNYGVDYPLQSNILIEKYKDTCYNKYGVYYISQFPLFFNKAQKNMRGSHKSGFIEINNENIFYRSSYEEIFLNSIKLSKIPFTIISNIPIDYFYNKQRKYFADFIVNMNGKNILFEIKPEKLVTLPLNKIKFEAAEKFIKINDISEFVILTEKDLFFNFNIEKYFL